MKVIYTAPEDGHVLFDSIHRWKKPVDTLRIELSTPRKPYWCQADVITNYTMCPRASLKIALV